MSFFNTKIETNANTINITTTATTTTNSPPISQSQEEVERRTQDPIDCSLNVISLTKYDITNVDTSELLREKDQSETVYPINIKMDELYALYDFFHSFDQEFVIEAFQNKSESPTKDDLLTFAYELNHPYLALRIKRKKNVETQKTYCRIMLVILGLLPKDTTDTDETINELNELLANIDSNDSNHKNVEKSFGNLNAVPPSHKKLFPVDHSDTATTTTNSSPISEATVDTWVSECELVHPTKENDPSETVTYINANINVLYGLCNDFLSFVNNISDFLKNQSEKRHLDDLLAIAPCFNYPILASLVKRADNVEKQVNYCSIMLAILGLLPKDTTNTDKTITELHKHLAHIYLHDSKHKNIEQGFHHLNAAFQIHKRLSPDDHSGTADLLFLLGKAHRCLDKNLSNTLNSLLSFEESLKICLSLVSTPPINYAKLSEIYTELVNIYKELNDINKALDCLKKVHWLNAKQVVFGQKSESLESKIQSLLQTKALKGIDATPPCISLSYGKIDPNLAQLKQKIQTALLNPIAEAIENGYGWSYISLGYDWGVKGYLDRDHVRKILKGLGEKEENIEPAQMLCFEAMNLAIGKLTEKFVKYNIVGKFVQAYPDLIKRILNEHPEFLVNNDIVFICKQATFNDESKINFLKL